MESEAIVTSRCGRRAALGSAGAVAWMVLMLFRDSVRQMEQQCGT